MNAAGTGATIVAVKVFRTPYAAVFLACAVLFSACAEDPPPAPIFVVADCIEDSDISEACIDSWNTLVVQADPGLRRAMTAYDKCIEAGGWEPFDPSKCKIELSDLLALFP